MSVGKEKHKPSLNLERFLREAELHESAGDFVAAFQSLSSGARFGEAACFTNLGNFYAAGTGTGKDLRKAAYWYRKAYAEGSSTGALNLAIDRRNSGNVRSAVFWFKRAVALEDGSACVELAKIFKNSRGGKSKAITLLERVSIMGKDGASELDQEHAAALLLELR